MTSDDLLISSSNTLTYITKNTLEVKNNQSTAFAANWKGSVMEPSIDTKDVREPRPFKINAYVHPDRAAYLKKLAKDNSRKISAQLDLILREHEAANG
nr:hypothetical protein 8 [Paracoccaceae bacterium]